MAANGAEEKPRPRGGKFCVAGRANNISCKNNQHTEGISMHTFPKNENVRWLWTKFVRKHRPHFQPSNTSVLCSAHFDWGSFERQTFGVLNAIGGRRRLAKGAVPSLDGEDKEWEPVPISRRRSRNVARQMVKDCLEENNQATMETQREEEQDDSETDSASSEQHAATFQDLYPTATSHSDCKCTSHQTKIKALQKKLSWYRRTKNVLRQHLQTDEISSSDGDSDIEGSEEEDFGVPEDNSDDYFEDCVEDEDDMEWLAEETESESDSDKADGSEIPHTKNFVRVNSDTEVEPKFLVFYSMLVQLFSMFCFRCKGSNPEVEVKKNGTMAIVTQVCKACGSNTFQWRSQPFVLGKYPAGNLMMSFGILLSGVNINQAMLLFRHMGICAISARTYFMHQRQFLFPAILNYWQKYQTSLLERLKNVKDATFSGDGRFDSMGHSAKYGVYTMFCNSVSKLVHFELLQSNQSGSSNAMELDGAKRCFAFLSRAGINIHSFISDRHLGISKWLKTKSENHYFDVWHVSKSFSKKLLKASKEKGCEILKDWIKALRNHMYWCATSTKQGFGELIAAKWQSVVRHVADKHSNHPNRLFPKCCHGDLAPRKWIKIGTVAYDRLYTLVTNTRTVNDIRKLSSDAQTSCLEGFHSTLNHWHPKMTHFSWLGTYCRHVIAVLHFNENLHRQPQTTKDGKVYFNVRYPKFKHGEEVVREVAVPPTYDYVDQIRRELFNTNTKTLKEVFRTYSSKVPEPLTSQFTERLTKEEAVKQQESRNCQTTLLFPGGEQQNVLQKSVDVTPVEPAAAGCKPRTCKKCTKPMKGHSRGHCTNIELPLATEPQPDPS